LLGDRGGVSWFPLMRKMFGFEGRQVGAPLTLSSGGMINHAFYTIFSISCCCSSGTPARNRATTWRNSFAIASFESKGHGGLGNRGTCQPPPFRVFCPHAIHPAHLAAAVGGDRFERRTAVACNGTRRSGVILGQPIRFT